MDISVRIRFQTSQTYSIGTIRDLGHETILRKSRFDLAGTKTAEKRRLNNDRMSRQMYAITCRTDIAGKKQL
jgi:hypothetical protein